MAASGVNVSGGAEIYFAKKLASNEKTVRDKAVKKLRTWISTGRSVSSGLTKGDMLKLWKGLFYCMWMSDKPKVQEELAETIAELLHSFQLTTAAVDYLDGFYKTICREWHGIDRLRLDKFYLLIRRFVYQSIAFLKNHSWENEVVEEINKVLENGPLSTSMESQLVPVGVKTHIIQVYLEEMSKCESFQIPHSVLLHLLQPFIQLLATSKSKVITETLSKEIFTELLKKHQQDDSSLKIDIQAMSDTFFSWASRKDIPTRNRHILYKYIDRLKSIPKEHDSGIKVNGLDGSTCSTSDKASVNNCNSISMAIDGDEECEVHTKKIKKGDKGSENNIVEGVESIYDMANLSAVNGSVKKKRKRKNKTSNEGCMEVEVEDGGKGSVEDSIAMCEFNESKEQHDEMSKSVEDNKTKKTKCKKRKCSKTGNEENNTAAKKTKNKICGEETHGSDVVDKHGKKEKKLRNKSVVVQDSNDVVSVESENNMKGKLSREMEMSTQEESERMNYTSDSLDGSYLSTLPKQARDVTSHAGNVVKTSETAEGINKEESLAPSLYNAKTAITDMQTIDMSTKHGLGKPDPAMHTDTAIQAEEDVVAKDENIELTPDSMPLSTFLRHSLKKAKANTEPRTPKESKKRALRSQASSGKKKVRIELSKNTSHTTRDYRRSLKCSPVIPFNADKKPVQSSLKTPPAAASKTTSQPRKRPTAVDYF